MDLVLRSGALAAVPSDILLLNIPQLLNMGGMFSQFIFVTLTLSQPSLHLHKLRMLSSSLFVICGD